MTDSHLDDAKERIVNEAIAYCARRPGSGPPEDLRDAINDLVDLAQSMALAEVYWAEPVEQELP